MRRHCAMIVDFEKLMAQMGQGGGPGGDFGEDEDSDDGDDAGKDEVSARWGSSSVMLRSGLC